VSPAACDGVDSVISQRKRTEQENEQMELVDAGCSSDDDEQHMNIFRMTS